MINTQIKSKLRNKSNKIYIIIFILLFIILNFSLNIQKIVDFYYDIKMEKIINKDERIDKDSRTIYMTKEIILTEQDRTEIMKIKCVEDIKTEIKDSKIGIIDEETGTTEFVDTKLTINYIIVDDWKNCKSIQKYFDSKGIETRILLSQFEIYKNYESIRAFVNIEKYVLMGSFLLLTITCYKNILKNEEENIKLLKVVGGNKRKIAKVMFIFIMTLVMIGYILATGIFSTFFLVMNDIKNALEIERILSNFVINIILTIFPLLIVIHIKLKTI